NDGFNRSRIESARVESGGSMADFEIRDLRGTVEGREILKGISLDVNKGEVHAVMGPHGSGKSTLSHTLMGHPNYTVTSGEVIFKGKNLRSEEHTSELQSRGHLVCRLLLEKKKYRGSDTFY